MDPFLGEGAGDPSGAVPSAGGAGGLPVDLASLVFSLRRRAWVLLLALVPALVAGFALRQWAGKLSYRSAAVLLFTPQAWDLTAGTPGPTLSTHLHLVKAPETLREVREDLGLAVSLEALGRAVEVEVQRNTTLLNLSGTWSDPETARAIVDRTVRAFLGQLRQIRLRRLERQLEGERERYARAQADLRTADRALHTFHTENHLVDLDKETGWYLDEITELGILLEKAKMRRKTVALQSENIHRIIAELKAKVTTEKQDLAQMERIEHINTRVERLQESIDQDRKTRTDTVNLAALKSEYERLERLAGRGVVTRVQAEQAKARYELARVQAIDPPHVVEWKRQMKELDERLIPEGDASTPSMTMLHDMMLKAFDLRLEGVSNDEEVAHLEAAQARVQAKLERLVRLEGEEIERQRAVATGQAELAEIQASIHAVEHAMRADTGDFSVVIAPQLQPVPVRSNRKLVFLAGFLGVFAGVTLVLAGVLVFEPSILGPGDVRARSRVPVLAAFPAGSVRSAGLQRLGLRLRRLRPADARTILLQDVGDDAGAERLLDGLASEGVEVGPELLEGAGAEFAAVAAGAVVLVVRAGRARHAELEVVRLRLAAVGARVLGVVVLDVPASLRLRELE